MKQLKTIEPIRALGKLAISNKFEQALTIARQFLPQEKCSLRQAENF